MKINICFILTIYFSLTVFSQQTKFTTGVYSNLSPPNAYRENLQQVHNMNTNTVINHTNEMNKNSLETLFDNVIVLNAYSQTDYIHHYSVGYYTKWQAEENVNINAATPGIKHQFGTNGGTYWYSGINSGNIGKYLVTGPDYRQDRQYREWYLTQNIRYFVNFNMKIDGALTGVPVCEISISYRNESGQIAILNSKTFNANQLSNSFINYTLDYTIPETINGSPVNSSIVTTQNGISSSNDIIQQNSYTGAYGVQFNIKWLGNRNLYVDYIEVYDQNVWGDYLIDPISAKTRILNYIATASTENTKYWYSLDEPHSIDNYEPYKVVENILTTNGYQPLITAFYPGWDGVRNNELTIKRFLETVNPKILMYYYYPYYYDQPGDPYPDEKCLYFQRALMQQPFDSGFPLEDYYYVAQSFGYSPHCINNPKYQWRKPNPNQLRATVMLALAHGVKGIFFWPYYSESFFNATCNQNLLLDAIVDINNNPTDLYYEIKNNLFPRLNNSLGNTLVNLKYTGNYIYITKENHSVNSNDFLTIQDYGSDYNWQAGFLNNKLNSDNKHFMLVNLRTNESKTARLSFTNTSGRPNLRIRDVEDPLLDLTINGTYSLDQTIAAGEGKLFQVAPVTKFGGNLKYNEALNGTNSLFDAMIIKSGAKLTVSGTYNIYSNITVEDGGEIFINSGAILNFYNSASLIVQGTLSAVGTSVTKITFNFNNKQGGIELSGSGTKTFKNCRIVNANVGISTYASSPTIQNCDINSNNTGISLAYGGGGIVTNNNISLNTVAGVKFYSSSTQNFYSNLISNNGIGIKCENYSSPKIQSNTVAGNTHGIYIYYSAPSIIDNDILNNSNNGIYGEAPNMSPYINYNNIIKTTNLYNYQGIYLNNNTSPYITENVIQGYAYGIYYGGGGNGRFYNPNSTTPAENNLLYGNDIGITVAWGSTVTGGAPTNPYIGGNNSIWGNNELDAFAYQQGTFIACKNWWGYDGIQISTNTGGTIVTLYPLPNDPRGSSPPPIALLNNPTNSENITKMSVSKDNTDYNSIADILKGISLENSGDIDGAINHFKKMIRDNSHKSFALTSLGKIFVAYSKKEALDFLETEMLVKNENRSEILNLIASLKFNELKEKGFDKAMELYDMIIKEEPDSYYALNAKLEKVFAAIHFKDDIELAEKFLNEISNESLIDESFIFRKEMAQELTNDRSIKNNVKKETIVEEVDLPKSYSLLGNYPNPFNPSTTISYSLPYESSVDLTVYDIMGREVKSFNINSQTAGTQNILWDGTNENGNQVSSGIYIYRITLKSLESNEVFTKTAKLIMLK